MSLAEEQRRAKPLTGRSWLIIPIMKSRSRNWQTSEQIWNALARLNKRRSVSSTLKSWWRTHSNSSIYKSDQKKICFTMIKNKIFLAWSLTGGREKKRENVEKVKKKKKEEEIGENL